MGIGKRISRYVNSASSIEIIDLKVVNDELIVLKRKLKKQLRRIICL
jgi:hypothetical protein